MKLSDLKAIHWASIGLLVLAYTLQVLSKQDALAPVSVLLQALSAIIGGGSVGAALASPKLEFSGRGPQRGVVDVFTAFVVTVCAIGTLVCLAMFASGCTPAQSAAWAQVEPTVWADVEAGKSLEQIESDVAFLLVGKSGPELVAIVDDALAFLVDSGVLSGAGAAKAHDLRTKIAAVPR